MNRASKTIGALWQRQQAPVIQFNRVAFVIGIMLLVLMVFMLPPAITDIIAKNRDWEVFAVSAFVTGFIGLMLVLVSRGRWSDQVSRKEGFVLTVSAWIILSSVSAIPFLFLGRGLSPVDAWFEAVSGMTATGSTVMSGLDGLPPGILLWRSIIQWIGGIGIVVMALIMLPFLRVGGMQLFQTESSDRTDKFVPRAGQLIGMIALTYFILTVICAIAFRLAGMTSFDALNHAMTTIATGGFSTHDKSFDYFYQPEIHWIATGFMIMASLPLVLYVKAVRSRDLRVWNDEQVRGFLAMLALVIIAKTVWLSAEQDVPLASALRVVSFNVVSIISTTGYSAGDYTDWGHAAFATFFLFIFLGGCTGSTTGGMKTFRAQIMWLAARAYIKQLMSPHRVVLVTYNGKQVSGEITAAVLAYMAVLFSSMMAFTVVLSFFRLDFITSLTGAATALMNVGPGLGDIIGPAGNFGSLPDGAKVVLIVAMLLGRLEFFTVLVVLNRDFWR